MHFAEFGVVMMLFLIGLELKPSLLWKLRIPILGLGGLQVGITAGVITLATILLSALPWQTALAIGLTLAIIPLLAVNDIHVLDTHQSALWTNGLPIGLKTALILGVISSIVLAGRYLIGPLFRLVALTGLRELFTAAALLLIIAITYLRPRWV